MALEESAHNSDLTIRVTDGSHTNKHDKINNSNDDNDVVLILINLIARPTTFALPRSVDVLVPADTKSDCSKNSF